MLKFIRYCRQKIFNRPIRAIALFIIIITVSLHVTKKGTLEPIDPKLERLEVGGPSDDCLDKLQKRIFTNTVGRHNYFELWTLIYKPRNYKIPDSCITHPWLKLENTHQFTPGYCKAVFNNWTETSSIRTKSPELLASLVPEYSLGGIVDMGMGNQTLNHIVSESLAQNWTKVQIDASIIKGALRQNFHYKDETQVVYSALDTVDVTGKLVAVIGSKIPWLEAILLSRSASEVHTIEYTPITSGNPQVIPFHPIKIAHKFLNGTQPSYDFIASFSSIENSGLGHYGDTLDPFGDVKEMQKCWCLLKPGGLMLLGFMITWDAIYWNLVRSYGPYRMPMMTAGFEVVSLFTKDQREPLDWKDIGDRYWIYAHHRGQKAIILRKISE